MQVIPKEMIEIWRENKDLQEFFPTLDKGDATGVGVPFDFFYWWKVYYPSEKSCRISEIRTSHQQHEYQDVVVSKTPKPKPSLLIVDNVGVRNTFLQCFYDELLKSKVVNVMMIKDNGCDIEEIIKNHCSNRYPNYLYIGMNSHRVISSPCYRKIPSKIILDPGDSTFFHSGEYLQRIGNIDINFYVVRGGMTRTEYAREIRSGHTKWPSLQNTQILVVPWAVDTTRKVEVDKERDIDIAFICTQSEAWYHANRCKISKMLDKVKEKNSNLNIVNNNIYGKEYEDVLSRTKICVIDTSMRGRFLQKHVEAGLFGCMVIGDEADDSSGILEDGISFVRANTIGEIEQNIMKYLDNNAERLRMACEYQERILNCRDVKDIVRDFEVSIIHDYYSEKEKIEPLIICSTEASMPFAVDILEQQYNRIAEDSKIIFINKERDYGNAKIFYFVGFFDISALSYLKKAKEHGLRTVLHWVGTDVMMAKPAWVPQLENYVDIHLAVHPRLVKELRAIGINAIYMPLVPDKESITLPNIKDFVALSYTCSDRREFYGEGMICELAKRNPDIKFHIVGTDKPSDNLPDNVRYLGYVDDKEKLSKIHDDAYLYLRLTKHDGLPKMMITAMLKGRYVISSYPYVGAYCAKNVDDVEKMIRYIYATYYKKNILNIDGAITYNTLYNLEQWINIMERFFFSMLEHKVSIYPNEQNGIGGVNRVVNDVRNLSRDVSNRGICNLIHTYAMAFHGSKSDIHSVVGLYFPEDDPSMVSYNVQVIERARTAGIIHTDSLWLREILANSYNLSSFLISNAVCCESLPSKTLFIKKYKITYPYFLYVGTLRHVKRPAEFISLAKKLPNEHFIMIGRDLEKTQIEKEYGKIPSNIEVFSEVKDDMKFSAMYNAKAVVTFSINDASPASDREVMASCGVLVAKNVKSHSEVVIHGVNGYLFNDFNDCIAILNGIGDTKNLRWAARKTIKEKFNINYFVYRLEKLYSLIRMGINSKENPLVSIIIPLYNKEQYIEDTILSVLNQSYMMWELIVVDDGSTDSGANIVEKYTSIDPRILLVQHEKNKGCAYAVGTGLKYAVGKYHRLMGADDKLKSNALEICVKFLESHSQYDAVYTGYEYIDKGSHFVSTYPVESYTKERLMEKDIVPCLTMCWNSKLTKMSKGADNLMISSEDWDLWLNFVLKCNARITMIPNVTCEYRVGVDNKCLRNRENGNLSIVHNYMRKKYLLSLPCSCGCMEYSKKSIEKSQRVQDNLVRFRKQQQQDGQGLLFYKKVIEDVFNVMNTEKILDVGCGTGSVKTILSSSCMYLGIDPCVSFDSEYMKRGFAEDIPVESGMFDWVFCFAALDYVLSPNDSVREFNRVLRMNGHLGIILVLDRPESDDYTWSYSEETLKALISTYFEIEYFERPKTSLWNNLCILKAVKKGEC